MPPTSDPSLYGIPRPTRAPKNPISTSTSLSFTSHLTSLLASTRSSSSSTVRPRPSKRTAKDDIFTSHNRGAKKRAAADTSTDSSSLSKQNHNANIGAVDSEVLHRSKRKMEEKARLYAAMKRGDYIPPSHKNRGGVNGENEPLIDFDRKWAEQEAAGKDPNYDTSSGSDDGASDTEAPEDKEMVEYTDEFNRLRRGTRAEAAREERRRKASAHAAEELQSMSARPAAPVGLIYGDTIQAAAFNPDREVEKAMEELVAKRDREATPPEEVHYDASKEVRSKGVGFYAFSGGKEERAKEMKALEEERRETERRKVEREEKVRKRREEVERRRREVAGKRGEKLADAFLDELGGYWERGRRGMFEEGNAVDDG